LGLAVWCWGPAVWCLGYILKGVFITVEISGIFPAAKYNLKW